ncbi:MAG: 3-hydroxyacyl-CoA dehydrogenase family protein [Ferruginibacter sp.]
MKIVITGSRESIEELTQNNAGVDWVEVKNVSDFLSHIDADAFINLHPDAAVFAYPETLKCIFINSVITPLSEMKAHNNLVRINGWKGFLKREIWELATEKDNGVDAVLRAIGKKFLIVKDQPGLISARILAMIINEAYFAKEEGVSTETEIDIAMQLGTNYPKGPFSWAEEIGKKNILLLLNKLMVTDKRYTPAPLLQQEARSA